MSHQSVAFSAGPTVIAGAGRTPSSSDGICAAHVMAGRAHESRVRAGLNRAATVLTAVGLFTISWDRLLNVQVASYNVKLPSLVFTIAFLLAALATRRRISALVGERSRRVIAALTAAIVLYEAVRAIATPSPAAAAAQVVAVLTGAVLPAATLLLVLHDRAGLRWALRWLLRGALVAAAFGVYQLTAFYLGWPQGITYTGVGIGSSLGRISAFNYEPAYFAYFAVLALGAYVALRRLDGGDVQWLPLIGFAAILYLANVRAVPIVVLAFALLLLVAFRSNRRLLLRGAIVTVATVAVALAVPVVVASVSAAQQQAADRAEQTAAGAAPTDRPSATESPSPPTGAEPPARALQNQLQTTVDPTEPSSNGPRLDLYRAVLAEVGRSPVFGLGPGQLAGALRSEAPQTVQDQGGGQVVANNVWLQALADGGAPLLALELALVVTVAVMAWRHRRSAAFPLVATWAAVLGVGGMLTSYFFDIKVWVVLALVLVGFTVGQREAAAREVLA